MLKPQAKEAFYSDLPADRAQEAFDSFLFCHSQDTFETVVDFVVANVAMPKPYIICKKDLVFDRSSGGTCSHSSGARGPEDQLGHSPFLSKPKECAELMLQIIKGPS